MSLSTITPWWDISIFRVYSCIDRSKKIIFIEENLKNGYSIEWVLKIILNELDSFRCLLILSVSTDKMWYNYFDFIPSDMQAEYQLLPKRNGKSDGSFKKLQTIKYYTNYFDISLNTNKSQIYQYSFTLPETIPQDSEVYGKSISFAKKTLK